MSSLRLLSTRKRLTRALLLTIGILIVGCNFDVQQPGRAQDDTLNDLAAAAPLVAGMSEALSHALWQIAFITAETSREYVEGGRIFTTMIISAALIEGATLFAVVACFLVTLK